jgi:hypothetical protein
MPSKKRHDVVLADSFMLMVVGPTLILQLGGPPAMVVHDFLQFYIQSYPSYSEAFLLFTT